MPSYVPNWITWSEVCLRPPNLEAGGRRRPVPPVDRCGAAHRSTGAERHNGPEMTRGDYFSTTAAATAHAVLDGDRVTGYGAATGAVWPPSQDRCSAEHAPGSAGPAAHAVGQAGHAPGPTGYAPGPAGHAPGAAWYGAAQGLGAHPTALHQSNTIKTDASERRSGKPEDGGTAGSSRVAGLRRS